MTTRTLPHDVHHPACTCEEVCALAAADRARDAYWRGVIVRMLAGLALGLGACAIADPAGTLRAIGWPL